MKSLSLMNEEKLIKKLFNIYSIRCGRNDKRFREIEVLLEKNLMNLKLLQMRN
jgi:hypothetical protein